jgi:hypothetical protein
MNPGDAIRAAQADALGRFAEAVRVQIVSERVDDGTRSESRTVLSTREVLARVRIAAVEAEPGRHANDLSSRTVHALACDRGGAGAPTNPSVPQWLIDPRRAAAPGVTCAVGLAGPTFDAAEQAPIAERDAARALAATQRVLVERQLVDRNETDITVVKSEASVDDGEVDAVAGRMVVSDRWDDRRGEGPLGLPGVHYVIACATLSP